MTIAPSSLPPRLQNRRVLVVEDDFLIGDALTEVLEAQGAVVIGPIGWTFEALAVIGERAPGFDIAVLDVDLHGERSYPIADALISRGIPFVFTTGYNAEAVEPAYRNHIRYEKPLSGTALVAGLAAMIEACGQDPD